MGIIYMLLALSLVIALIFFVAFIISVKNGQYDDSYTPSVRMLFEDELVKPTTINNRKAPTVEKQTHSIKNNETEQNKGKRI